MITSAPSSSPGARLADEIFCFDPADCQPVSFIDRTARSALLRCLRGLQDARLRIIDRDGEWQLGGGTGRELTMVVRNAAFYRHTVLGGSLSFAESYLRGDWSTDDLTGLFRLFARNIDLADRLDQGLTRLMQWPARLYHSLHSNSRQGSQRNIHMHYDLGNEFFSLILDETMAYSSGVFLTPAAALVDASVEKMDRLCRKLDLQPTDHLLEIGTGWGGLAMHAAQNYGCKVTTTTISQEQYQWAVRRVAEAGLSDKVEVLLQDYRDLTGQYDKLVSVEMIEAVGHEYMDDYFRQCSRLLRPEGSFAVQAIVIGEQRRRQYERNVDFIQRYVFPGGCLPSVASLLDSSGRASDLRPVHLEDFAPHYAWTLNRWRQNFIDRLDDVRRLGYPDRFLRLWHYYLCYCEAGFAERYLGVVHLQLDKPDCPRDPGHITTRAADTKFKARTPELRDRASAIAHALGRQTS